ncbi:hypothetical protein OQA88_3211 [Cercophora sp. LCS_1]
MAGIDSIEYAALSYCWGENLPLCTTTDVLAQFTQEIPSDLMPATFADAMKITRALGIPYIWIDALCIVQDDSEDWQREAAVMNKVYGGCQLTIAASQSRDSATGCFPVLDQDFINQDVSFRAHNRLIRFYYDDVRIRPGSGNTLSARAWALQEQIPREPPQTPASALRLRIRWEKIVENYSERLLTYERDRVPAVAGVIQSFASVMPNNESILGLWRATLARDMAWSRLSVRVQERGLGDPALPSWTWLACPGPATFRWWEDTPPSSDGTPTKRSRGPKEHLHLLTSKIEWSGTPYTSPLKSAHLEVEAPVMTIALRPTREQLKGKMYGYFQVFGENLRGDASEFYRCFGFLDHGDLTGPAPFPCMLLFTSPKGQGEAYEVFIIMEPVGPPEDRRFRRIGAAGLLGKTPAFDLEKKMTITLV